MSNPKSDHVSISLLGGQELANLFQRSLEGQPESTSRVTQPKRLGGEAPTYVLVATLALKELPVVLARLRDLADSLPIRRAEIDGVKYENISSKELKNLLAERSKSPPKTPKAKDRNR